MKQKIKENETMINKTVEHDMFGKGKVVGVYETCKRFNPKVGNLFVIEFKGMPRLALFKEDFILVKGKKK